jgi:signal transduction histidine kinase
LWAGLRNGSVFRVDCSEQRWKSYDGLNFQGDTPDGTEWFLSADGSAVRHRLAEWTKYGVEDGLISNPVVLLCTKDGQTWAAGSHGGLATAAYFDGSRWHQQQYPDMGWTVDFRSAFEGADGRVWFAANNESLGGKRFSGGLAWVSKSASGTIERNRLRPPQVPDFVSGITQTTDGRLCYGGMYLAEQHETNWVTINDTSKSPRLWIDAVAASPSGDLWVAQGGIGVFRGRAGQWTRFDTDSGLADLVVSALLCAADGSVWAATPKGISRFDGQSWTPNVFGTPAIAMDRESGTLRQSRDGRIWINVAPRRWYFRARLNENLDPSAWASFRTVAYSPRQLRPETRLNVTFDKVSQAGNTLIAWEGTEPWNLTPARQFQFSYRFDGGIWSPYQAETEKMFLALASGQHAFEVRARDADFNVDPMPARFQFTVEAPVWQQAWFQGLLAAFVAALGIMQYRIIRRNYRLREEVGRRQRAQDMIERQKDRLAEQNIELEAQRNQLVAHKDRLELEIEHRKAAEIETEKANRQLVNASRQAGKAEVATGVLHNVGNVLNSVNISATVISDRVRKSVAGKVGSVAALLDEHAPDPGAFLTRDPKGQKLRGYVRQLSDGLAREQREIQEELALLRKNIDHIKGIVAMQQEHARFSGVVETLPVREMVENAMEMHVSSCARNGVQLVREFQELPAITTDKYKVLQILVNLLHNAKRACDESGRADKRIIVRTAQAGAARVRIEVADNGVGIPLENLTRIFGQGFTTHKDGHGFGLHSSAIAARELGGTLTAASEGLGRGAVFTLELPANGARPS